MTKRYDTLEIIRHKVTMSQRIASRKEDQDFGKYAGAPQGLANQMAMLDFLLESGKVSDKLKPKIMFYRELLDKERKAFFASYATEITQLGFILGKPKGRKSALNQP